MGNQLTKLQFTDSQPQQHQAEFHYMEIILRDKNLITDLSMKLKEMLSKLFPEITHVRKFLDVVISGISNRLI